MAKRVGVAILGCGAVGSATAEMLLRERSDLADRVGIDLEIRSILVRNPDLSRSDSIPAGLITTEFSRALNDPETRIIVELIGGVTSARDFTLAAFRAGKDVVTANKALLALHGAEVFATARMSGRCIAFEAAVGGGIPLIESIRCGLVANRIDAIYGILNGTSNYILTRMGDEKVAYADALAEAQSLGFAEADPSLDVKGIDSAHKLSVLASVAMREACDFNQITHQGITDIEVTDLVAGEALGYVCRLLAIARRHGAGITLCVRPMFVPTSHPLAGVRGPFNAVSIYGDAAGHVMFYGRGAGGGPTASAVISDIVEVACGNTARVFESRNDLPDRTPAARHGGEEDRTSAFYLRVGLQDKPGGMAAVAQSLGDQGVSIASLVQHQPHETHTSDAVPVVVVTHPATEHGVLAAIRTMSNVDYVVGRVVCIPIMDEDAASQ